MAESILDRVKNAYNAFMNRDPPEVAQDHFRFPYQNLGLSSTDRPDRTRMSFGNEKSIIAAVYNRLAVDCASVSIRHAKLDDSDRYVEDMKTGLNECLTIEANKDQTARAFMQDVYMSLFDEGCIAIVPIDTDKNPDDSSFDILSMRTGRITQWWPDHVRVECYNDRLGKRQEIVMPKSEVAIIENPFYSVMNERNSVLKRLIRKMNLLDVVDEQNSSGKLDLIIQLPYIIKTPARREQAEQRRKDIEMQLSSSKYGIAYTDGTEHITQLNRAVESKLTTQIEYLTNLLYSQLGLSQAIMDGTADETAMLNYTNRTCEPIIAAVVDGMKRTFLTKTARTQHKSIIYFQDPFRLMPVSQIAEIADKFTRNEIMSSNEIRQKIGLKPVNDPAADQLRNKNLNATEGQQFPSTSEGVPDGTIQYTDGQQEDDGFNEINNEIQKGIAR